MARKYIYLIRHGESVANTKPVFQGLTTPLSEKGREQAKFIAGRVSRLGIQAIVSSPLERAKQTALVVSEKVSLPVEYSPLFEERKKPIMLNDRPHSDQEASALFKEWEESLFEGAPRVQDGENFDDIHARAKEALQHLASRKEEKILVVTHGMFLRALTAVVVFDDLFTVHLFGKMKKHVKTENSGLSVFLYDPENSDPVWGSVWKLITLNDHAHLG